MTSIIWLNDYEGDELYNMKLDDFAWNWSRSVSSRYNDRVVIAKGNIIENRVGK